MFRSKNKWEIFLKNDSLLFRDLSSRKSGFDTLRMEVIRQVFASHAVIGLSQMIDRDVNRDFSPQRYIAENSEGMLGIALTGGYTSSELLAGAENCFVLHAAGTLNQQWLQPIIQCGTNEDSLANVIYGLAKLDGPWLDAIIQRNQVFVDWYNLRIPAESLDERFDPVVFTSDGDLVVRTCSKEVLYRLVELATEIARDKNAELIVEKAIDKIL